VPEVTVPFQRPDFVNGTEIPAIPAEFELQTSKVCNENYAISLIAEEDGTVQGTYSKQIFVNQDDGPSIFDENIHLHIAPLIGFWNNKDGKCSFTVVDTDSSLTIEGSISDDELHVEAAAPGGCEECLAPTQVNFSRDPPTLGLPTGPFPTTFQGTFTKKDDICMDTDTPENEACRASRPVDCLLSCCVDSGSTEEACFALGPKLLDFKEGCQCLDTVNFGCKALAFVGLFNDNDVVHTDIAIGSPICGKTSYVQSAFIDSDSFDTTFPNIFLTLDSLNCESCLLLEEFSPVVGTQAGAFTPSIEDVSFYTKVERSYNLPPGDYAVAVSVIGSGLECDSPLKRDYRIEIIDRPIDDGVDVITYEVECPSDFECPAGADTELQEICVSSPVDDINAGCFLDTPAYVDYTVGNTFCGTLSSYTADVCPDSVEGDGNPGFCSDNDLFQFTVPETGMYEFTIAADKLVSGLPFINFAIKSGDGSMPNCDGIIDVDFICSLESAQAPPLMGRLLH